MRYALGVLKSPKRIEPSPFPVAVFRYAAVRAALAVSITAKISDFGQRDSPPSFTGLGMVPSATRRQKVGTLICKIEAHSRAIRSGSVIGIVQSHIWLIWDDCSSAKLTANPAKHAIFKWGSALILREVLRRLSLSVLGPSSTYLKTHRGLLFLKRDQALPSSFGHYDHWGSIFDNFEQRILVSVGVRLQIR